MIPIHRRCALGVSALLISFATLAPVVHAQGVTIPTGQSLYISDSYLNILRISGGSTAATADANTSTFASGLSSPIGLAFDSAGNLYAADFDSTSGSFISKITSTGTVSLFAAGGGLNFPTGLAFDSAGNLYAADFDSTSGSFISKITSTGAVSTFATGGGLNFPNDLAFDSAGNLYATNYYNDTISKITSTGTVSTLATGLNIPEGLAFDSAGDLFIANHGDTTIRTISQASLASGDPTVNLFDTLPLGANPYYLAFGPSPAAAPDAGSAWLVVAGLPLLGYVAYRRRRRAA